MRQEKVAYCLGFSEGALQVGADLAAGSLIKSPGGTIVPGGGYVAGRADLVAAAAARLTAPGVGTDAGCLSGSTLRLMFQGAAFDSCKAPGGPAELMHDLRRSSCHRNQQAWRVW